MNDRRPGVAFALFGAGWIAILCGIFLVMAAFSEARFAAIFLGWAAGAIVTGIALLALRAIIDILADLRALLSRRLPPT